MRKSVPVQGKPQQIHILCPDNEPKNRIGNTVLPSIRDRREVAQEPSWRWQLLTVNHGRIWCLIGLCLRGPSALDPFLQNFVGEIIQVAVSGEVCQLV